MSSGPLLMTADAGAYGALGDGGGRVRVDGFEGGAEVGTGDRAQPVRGELVVGMVHIQISNVSRAMRIWTRVCFLPLSMPGQVRLARSQVWRVLMTLGQKGQVRHWMGRSS